MSWLLGYSGTGTAADPHLWGPVTWSLSIDIQGHREYKIVFRVLCNETDGPWIAINCPGLPIPGITYWNFDNDVDPYAICLPTASVEPEIAKNEPNRSFLI